MPCRLACWRLFPVLSAPCVVSAMRAHALALRHLPAGFRSALSYGYLPVPARGPSGNVLPKLITPDRTAVSVCRLPNGSGAMDPHQAQLAAQQQQMAALLQQQFMQLGLPPPTPQQQLEFWQTTQAQQHQAQADQRQQPAAPSSTGEIPNKTDLVQFFWRARDNA